MHIAVCKYLELVCLSTGSQLVLRLFCACLLNAAKTATRVTRWICMLNAVMLIHAALGTRAPDLLLPFIASSQMLFFDLRVLPHTTPFHMRSNTKEFNTGRQHLLNGRENAYTGHSKNVYSNSHTKFTGHSFSNFFP